MRAALDPKDIIGRKFVALSVVGLDPVQRRDRRGKRLHFYNCVCDCGNSVTVVRGNLTGNHTRSCGCLKHRSAEKNPGWKGHGKISGYLWAHIRRHAKRSSRTLPFTITMQDAWDQYERQNGLCALTGWPLSIEHGSKQESTKTASLDRIDSEKGYEPGNIQWVHKDVNQMKWDLTNERFIEVCEAVVAAKRRPPLRVAV